MSIEAMKQALEALEDGDHWEKQDAITALRQAIAEAEKQEPVSWGELLKEADQIVRGKAVWKRFIEGTPLSNDVPVWMAEFAHEYANPPKREPLTPHEIGEFVGTHEFGPEQLKWFRYGESAHGIKGNT